MQFERSENYVPYYYGKGSPIGTQTNLGTLMQFERSENYVPYFLANISEFRYVDAVRTQVRTTIFKKLMR